MAARRELASLKIPRVPTELPFRKIPLFQSRKRHFRLAFRLVAGVNKEARAEQKNGQKAF